jgi:hypothetical protein
MPAIQIQGVVHQVQLNPSACWYTCMQMMARYYRSQNPGVSSVGSPEDDPEMQQRFDAGGNPNWPEWNAWATRLGFKPINISPTDVGFYQLLHNYGPVMYSGTWEDSFDGHIVLITGVNTDGDPPDIEGTAALWVDDPLDNRPPFPRSQPYDGYVQTLQQRLSDQPLFVYY